MGVLIAYQIGLLGRRRVGGILEEMQPIPAVFQLVIQLIADPTCPTVKRKKKSGLNLFPQQRSTAVAPRLENLAVWGRLRKDSQGLMTHSKQCEIPNLETLNAIYVVYF